MAVIRNLVVKIAADISGLSKGFKEAQSKLESLSDNLGNIGGMLSLKVTAPLVMLGKTALNTAADFEQSMANAASVSGANSEELERMTLLARVMGKETVFSASQAADAMYYMASAGYKVEQMENSIAAVLNLAAATQSELAFSTEVVIATLNQFQLDSSEAERVTNVFAAAIGNSQAKSITVFLNYLSPIWEQIKGIFASLWDVIRQLWIILEPILIAIGAVIVTLYGIFIGTINGIIQALGPLVQAIVSAAQFVIEILGAIISLITGDLDGAWEYLKSAGQSFVDFFVHLWEGLLNFVQGFVQGVKNFFLSLGVDLEAIFIRIGESISNFFSGIWKGITDFCSNIWKSVTGVFGDVKNFITNLISEAFNWGKNLITSIGTE